MPDPLAAPAAGAGAGGDNALLEALTLCASHWGGAKSWDTYLQQLTQVEAAASGLQSPVFEDVCVLLRSFIEELCQRHEQPEAGHHALLESWPTLAAAFCEFPRDPETGALLIRHLQDPGWPTPLSDEDAAMMQSFLVETGVEPEAGGEDTPEQAGFMDIGPEEDPVDAGASPRTAHAGVAGLNPAVREMVELLVGELEQMQASLTETLTVACNSESVPAERRDALEHYAEQVERLGMAAEVGGLEGLARISTLLHDNLETLCDREAVLEEPLRQALSVWTARVYTYLQNLGGEPACTDLMQAVRDPSWPVALSEDAASELHALLSAPMTDALMEDVEPRQATAAPDDVSLSLTDEVDPELLDGLLQELPAQTAEFTNAVQKLTAGEGGTGELDVAQRVAHTLKGAANTVGVPGIAKLTHHLEDILLALSKQSALPGPALGDVLQSAADCLEVMSESLLGQSAPPGDALEVLQSVLDWANRIDREGAEAAAADRPTTTVAPAPAGAGSEADPVPAPTAQPAEEKTAPREPAAAATGPMVRVPAALVDELLRLVGETIILTGQVHERVQRTVEQSRAMQNQNALLQQLGAELEQIIDLRDIRLPRQQGSGPMEFDPLELDQYNELHTVSRRLVEAATDSREIGRTVESHLLNLNDMLTQQGRLNRESQEAVMRSRMVAVETIVPRIQRSVRQAGRTAGKQVALECAGTDTLMDSEVTSQLVDPLMHLLRNAVDHGIEAEAERAQAGKDPKGHIRLEFHREGNHILVRCEDDGAGLDWAKIREAAQSRGLVKPGQPLTELELCQIILRPNFSTRASATQLSGRGIGLDAVQSRIARLGGSLSVSSETGKGCRFEFRLPLTLISTHALLVRARRQVLAVSNRGVAQILHPGSGQEHRVGDERTFEVGDEIYPATSLTDLLGKGPDPRHSERGTSPVLIVQSDSGRQAVLVDAILDSRDLVIKGLGRYVPKLRGVAGATILGDGSVAPVIDLPELLRASELAEFDFDAVVEEDAAPHSEESGLPCALVVDDSLSARRSLAQFIGDSGFEVRTARDGLEAIDVINSKRPDIVLVDLEMPRMNGLELTSHIRANSATRALPIIMITSRSTEKHRREAAAAGVDHYITKPFSEDELMVCVESLCRDRSGPAEHAAAALAETGGEVS